MPRGAGPRGPPRRERYSGVPLHPTSDFTVYDYAHSSARASVSSKTDRLKKGESNSLCSEVKKLNMTSQQLGSVVSTMELAWYEKDLEDFDEPDITNATINGLQDGDTTEKQLEDPQASRTKSFKTRKLTNGHIKTTEGLIYPIDLWFEIGRYIEPECVGVFALLCSSTRNVTHSAQFWQNLYRRYHHPTASLPPSLALSNIDRSHGLRSRVVRALHHLYPNYVARTTSMLDEDKCSVLTSLRSLEGATCIQQWYRHNNCLWHFYWKFHRAGLIQGNEADLLLSDPDVMYNREEHCVILQAICPNFLPHPQVTGQVFIKFDTSAGHGLNNQGVVVRSYSRGYKLKMLFHSVNMKQSGVESRKGGRVRGEGSATECVVDPAVCVDVINWWHPKYTACLSDV